MNNLHVAPSDDATRPRPLFRTMMQAGFECAAMIWPRGPLKGHRQEMQEGTGHVGDAVRKHYENAKAIGIQTFRSGLPWHKILLPGRWVEEPIHRAFRIAAEADVEVIWDLVHFGFPIGVSPLDPFFPELLAEFGRRVATIAREYGQTLWLCPINEPSVTAHFCGQVGQWAPAVRGRGYELMRKLVRAQIAVIKAVRAVDRDARFLYCDPFDGGRWQFEAVDLLAGKASSISVGGSTEFIDIVGINHYPHFRGPQIAACIADVSHHLGRPILISETSHHDGHPRHHSPSKAVWLRYVVDQCAIAARAGNVVEGICWYPAIDSPAWNGRRGEFWSHGLFRIDGTLDDSLAPMISEIPNVLSDLVRHDRGGNIGTAKPRSR